MLNLKDAYSQRCKCCPDVDDTDTDTDEELPSRNMLLPNPVTSQQREQSRQQDERGTRGLDVNLPDLNFSAAHFVAFRGFRERLHGHNYSVAIRLGSTNVQHDGYIIDFGDVKAAARAICKQLKERILVPALSDVMSVQRVQNQSGTQNVEIHCQDGSLYSFPADDCAILPIIHSTAEEISQHFWNELVHGGFGIGLALAERGVEWLEVSVYERPGQGASYRAEVSSSQIQKHANASASIAKAVTSATVPNPVSATPASSDLPIANWSPAIAARTSFEIAEAAYSSLLSTLGHAEASRIGPKTPARAAKAFFELTSGLSWADPLDHVRDGVFKFDGADDAVAVRDVQFHSLCEHHLLPFSGSAHIVYIPDKKILGLSKFARLLDVYARRPQVQEALSQQFVQGLMELLAPKVVMVVLEARHSCMSIRGVLQPAATTRTTAFAGPLKDDKPTRQLLLQNVTVGRSCL